MADKYHQKWQMQVLPTVDQPPRFWSPVSAQPAGSASHRASPAFSSRSRSPSDSTAVRHMCRARGRSPRTAAAQRVPESRDGAGARGSPPSRRDSHAGKPTGKPETVSRRSLRPPSKTKDAAYFS